ncbi:hypothetical protein BN159_p85 (plasmid) [Streptomyces davaonensis JCM 4913]|uniref:Uncharacterized protein n=1 Tax=Streptomyces davaonensis (strain DSM 101723 / JCM 4913 / KCC S-0913 / 768) TaxID=1214101 RepID=K4RGA6_STRDJ|nr:hypothetical protein BN159_p85 [Streptomyces davaonensis JCM 4913]
MPQRGHHRAPREDRRQHGHDHHLLACHVTFPERYERLERLLRGGADAPAEELHDSMLRRAHTTQRDHEIAEQ